MLSLNIFASGSPPIWEEWTWWNTTTSQESQIFQWGCSGFWKKKQSPESNTSISFMNFSPLFFLGSVIYLIFQIKCMNMHKGALFLSPIIPFLIPFLSLWTHIFQQISLRYSWPYVYISLPFTTVWAEPWFRGVKVVSSILVCTIHLTLISGSWWPDKGLIGSQWKAIIISEIVTINPGTLVYRPVALLFDEESNMGKAIYGNHTCFLI